MNEQVNNPYPMGFSKKYRVTDGASFRLSDFATAPDIEVDKEVAKKRKKQLVKRISKLQDVLFADDKWALLTIFQAMDAAGKDSSIKHLLTGVNPQGCQVQSFKRPTSIDLDHDYMWRAAIALPRRGKIGVFNRSYYEDVLISRVHDKVLYAQKLPAQFFDEQIWEHRFAYIRAFEEHLNRNGTKVIKLFLNLSLDEQKRRFINRIKNPEKNWKFDPNDIYERGFWDDYMMAYEEAIRATACKDAPWYVVPADNKRYARVVIADAVCEALESLDLKYPTLSEEVQEILEAHRAKLAQQ